MKKFLFVTVLALLLLTPLSAADQASAAEKFTLRVAGSGAHAGWTTCPAGPSVGETCTDSYIFAAEQNIRQDGTKSKGTVLSLSRYSYTLDGEGNYVYLSDSFGYTEDA